MIIFFLLVFLGGVVVVVSFLYRNQEKSLELTENFCPVEGPIYTLAILLDATDGVTEITKLSIKTKLRMKLKFAEVWKNGIVCCQWRRIISTIR